MQTSVKYIQFVVVIIIRLKLLTCIAKRLFPIYVVEKAVPRRITSLLSYPIQNGLANVASVMLKRQKCWLADVDYVLISKRSVISVGQR